MKRRLMRKTLFEKNFLRKIIALRNKRYQLSRARAVARTARFLQVSSCDQQSDDHAVFMTTNAEVSRGMSQRECVSSVCRLLQSG